MDQNSQKNLGSVLDSLRKEAIRSNADFRSFFLVLLDLSSRPLIPSSLPEQEVKLKEGLDVGPSSFPRGVREEGAGAACQRRHDDEQRKRFQWLKLETCYC